MTVVATAAALASKMIRRSYSTPAALKDAPQASLFSAARVQILSLDLRGKLPV
jgi:hypothetical protein